MADMTERTASKRIAAYILQFSLITAGVVAGAGSVGFFAFALAAVATAAGAIPYAATMQFSTAVSVIAAWSVLIAIMHGLMHPGCTEAAHVVWLAALGSAWYFYLLARLVGMQVSGGGTALDCMHSASRGARALARDHPACLLAACAATAVWFVSVDTAAAHRCDSEGTWIAACVRGLRANKGDVGGGALPRALGGLLSPVVRSLAPADDAITDTALGCFLLFIAVVVFWAVVVRLWPAVDWNWRRAEVQLLGAHHKNNVVIEEAR